MNTDIYVQHATCKETKSKNGQNEYSCTPSVKSHAASLFARPFFGGPDALAPPPPPPPAAPFPFAACFGNTLKADDAFGEDGPPPAAFEDSPPPGDDVDAFGPGDGVDAFAALAATGVPGTDAFADLDRDVEDAGAS